MKKFRRTLKKLWHFIWEDNSIWSWLANIVIAFVLIKFIVYPGLGFAFSTSHPVVAVVSESMEHDSGFDEWWEKAGKWYAENNIKKEDFSKFPLKNGFDRGDIMILKGKKAEDLRIGDVVVFWSAKRDPIIHRIVNKLETGNMHYFQTKGDNYRTNAVPIKNAYLDETRVSEGQIVGNAVFRIPMLGYIKIFAVEWFWEPIIKPLVMAITQKG